ncbi:DUF5753 domain-containing protein [Streptomyces sp. Lzd4kr]|nr:DUF5753 domain-containing protein [Streptomyces sp. Lzd4kr]
MPKLFHALGSAGYTGAGLGEVVLVRGDRAVGAARHHSLIPGHLQISDYITAIFGAGQPNPKAKRLIDLRMARQERVLDDGGPKVEMILDEAALRRQVGGAATMRQQLSFLKKLATEGRATLMALPFTAGAHDSMSTSFFLLGFPYDDDVLYVEGPGGALTNRDDTELVARYQECFEDLRSKALTEDAAIALLDDLIEHYHRS